MVEMLETNWLLVLIAFLIGLAIAWYVFRVNRKTRVRGTGGDVLDEGAERAKRNQALIDAKRTDDTPLPDTVPKTTSPPDAPVVTPVPVPAPAPAPETSVDPIPVDPTPPPIPATEPTTQADMALSGDAGSELTRIKGLGPKLATQLNDLGVTSIEQIAGWSDEDIARYDSQLGRFSGRIERDRWVEQARLLTSDDPDAFQREFGKLS